MNYKIQKCWMNEVYFVTHTHIHESWSFYRELVKRLWRAVHYMLVWMISACNRLEMEPRHSIIVRWTVEDKSVSRHLYFLGRDTGLPPYTLCTCVRTYFFLQQKPWSTKAQQQHNNNKFIIHKDRRHRSNSNSAHFSLAILYTVIHVQYTSSHNKSIP